jgi:hypothetical protein
MGSVSRLLGTDAVEVGILVGEILGLLRNSGGRSDSVEVGSVGVGLPGLLGAVVGLERVVVVGGVAIDHW